MAKLAINGGPKTIDRVLGKSWPIFGKEEERALLDVLHSGLWFRRGAPPDSTVTQFEDAFAAYQNAKECVAVNSGTQALEVALLAAGVQPGDEVIVSAVSFIASASAICQVGAVPVFVDIDPRTFNIDPTGAYLYCAGESADTMTCYRVAADTGELQPLRDYGVGSQPFWVMVTTLR